MRESQGAEAGGLLSALRNIAATLLATGRTRLELLANELEEEKLRAMRLFMVAQGMLFCFGVGILLVVAFLIALFWEQRLAVLGIFALLFLVLGGACLAGLRQAARRPQKPFSASLAELQEDLHQLKTLAGHEPPAR